MIEVHVVHATGCYYYNLFVHIADSSSHCSTLCCYEYLVSSMYANYYYHLNHVMMHQMMDRDLANLVEMNC